MRETVVRNEALRQAHRSATARVSATPVREVRLGLVLNGGVSLAVWIGGVTAEIDSLRWASGRVFGDAPPTDGDGLPADGVTALYTRLLHTLRQKVVVDVVGGASAGGINGALLAAAIYSGRRLPNLRDTWIGLGDFTKLLRPASRPNPPSLLKGDELMLPELVQTFAEIYEGAASRPRPAHPLYAYLTGTDFSGREAVFSDSTGRRFAESDHRTTFRFDYEPFEHPGEPATSGVMRDLVKLAAADAPDLLAHAARATASFPVAFEPHLLRVATPGGVEPHWFIDGGVLDNQPFNPVLDRIAVLPAELPVRRVVAYVVPYVTDPRAGTMPVAGSAPPQPGETAAPGPLSVFMATGSFPRDVPKFLGLERVSRDWQQQHESDGARRRLEASAGLPQAATALFPLYRRSRYEGALDVFLAWSAKGFRPGRGAIAQDEAVDPATAVGIQPHAPWGDPPDDLPWLPSTLQWSLSDAWRWGLGPSERVAAFALAWLRDRAVHVPVENEEIREAMGKARLVASTIVRSVRNDKQRLFDAFKGALPDSDAQATEAALRDAAAAAYEQVGVSGTLAALFTQLDAALGYLRGLDYAWDRPVPSVAELLRLEVVQNATATQAQNVPAPFVFIHMSAGIANALGHGASTPSGKVAGIQLGHFAGFLKRSWRANDWLWGRLDGTQHLLRALLDIEYLALLLAAAPAVAGELAEIAFPGAAYDEALRSSWETTLERNEISAFASDEPLRDQFTALLRGAVDVDERELARRRLECCRDALAARIQLEILKDELPRVARAVNEDLFAGTSRSAKGVDWARRVLPFEPGTHYPGGDGAPPAVVDDPVTLVANFRALDIGEETPADELSSRQGMSVASQAVAVASALAAGNRGGLPAPARSALASMRAFSLLLGSLVRLIASAPAFGLAALILLIGAIVWGLVDNPAVLGASLPVLIILAALLLVIVFTLWTSPLEGDLRTVWRVGGFAIALAGSAYVALAGWCGWMPGHDWAQEHLAKIPLEIIGTLAFAAAAALLVRRRQGRLKALWGFRLAVVLALGTAAGAYVYQRYVEGATCRDDQGNAVLKSWPCVANEHKGTILVLALIAASGAAALLAEYVASLGAFLRPYWNAFRARVGI